MLGPSIHTYQGTSLELWEGWYTFSVKGQRASTLTFDLAQQSVRMTQLCHYNMKVAMVNK